jgi:hypothetical protein
VWQREQLYQLKAAINDDKKGEALSIIENLGKQLFAPPSELELLKQSEYKRLQMRTLSAIILVVTTAAVVYSIVRIITS